MQEQRLQEEQDRREFANGLRFEKKFEKLEDIKEDDYIMDDIVERAAELHRKLNKTKRTISSSSSSAGGRIKSSGETGSRISSLPSSEEPKYSTRGSRLVHHDPDLM